MLSLELENKVNKNKIMKIIKRLANRLNKVIKMLNNN